MKKSQNVPVWFRDMALAQHYCTVWGGWYKAQQECRKECIKYDLTAPYSFSLAHRNDWFRWFAISSPPPILLSQFQFYRWGCKTVNNWAILGREKYVCRVTYWALLEMLLREYFLHVCTSHYNIFLVGIQRRSFWPLDNVDKSTQFWRLSSPTQQVPSSNPCWAVLAFHEEPPVMVFFFFNLQRIWFWFWFLFPRKMEPQVRFWSSSCKNIQTWFQFQLSC